VFTYLGNPFFNAELFFKWSNANLSISKMKISLECLSINYMLPSAQAPLICCWCGVPSCDYVVRRYLFCIHKYWWPNTIFHLGKSFNIFSNDGFCYVSCSQNFVDLWILIIGTQKKWRIHCFLFSRFSPIWHVINYCINVKNVISMSPWEYPQTPHPQTHTHSQKSKPFSH
jgi:hypothetical protein